MGAWHILGEVCTSTSICHHAPGHEMTRKSQEEGGRAMNMTFTNFLKVSKTWRAPKKRRRKPQSIEGRIRTSLQWTSHLDQVKSYKEHWRQMVLKWWNVNSESRMSLSGKKRLTRSRNICDIVSRSTLTDRDSDHIFHSWDFLTLR